MSDEATVERLLAAVKQRRERVNDAITEELPIRDPERLYEASRYLLDAGGKRLRPTVCLLVGEALTDVEPGSADYREFPALFDGEVDLLRAAVSIEVIQSFTLIHDDIMDDDDLRRGVPAVHREYDEETAILAGDTLYAKAFEFMTDTGSRPELSVAATNRLARTCTEICEGQALDVEFENRSGVLPEEYLEMVELKTAVLYGASAAIPAILLGADDETIEALRQYGIDSGRAFQIQDDVLDLTVPSEELGKQRGSDLVGEKETLITLHARQQGVDVDNLVDAGTADDLTETEVADAVATLEEAGSIEYARSKAEELTANSKEHLDVLPDNEASRLLADLADYLINRGY
ncbi:MULTISPECIES: geranylfarnesyl diphosphate synthase [Halolamina]|uniref:Geranylgeranyl diphosphate synthase, type I n=1 Tax=Halolamina pelagica TaxID=699431 RepID=A0A1I5MCN9_9EURY|nr:MULTISPECIES: polyprenyl synthetase family protein [Halolamina]NHX35969.1 polyprenyl synthetase family protein [Halolamina sp. R1-12]SFP07322.1 geranylgeranyl diphosphate synthase, type I [Halolamina pelagica]